MGEGPASIGFAIRKFVEAHRLLRAHGISDIVGDYGEKIAQMTIGGNLMPPAFKGYDLDHPRFGRVQVKTRALMTRIGGAPSNETRAVVGNNRDFDWLFHLVLDGDMVVQHSVLLPIFGVSIVSNGNSGKLSIAQSRLAVGAIDLTNDARVAQVALDRLA